MILPVRALATPPDDHRDTPTDPPVELAPTDDVRPWDGHETDEDYDR